MSDYWPLLSVIGGVDLGLLIVGVWRTLTDPGIPEGFWRPTISNTVAPTTTELNAGVLE